MTITTYTVYSSSNGTVYERGQTAVQAMDLILTHDGYEYEVRPAADGQGWELWHSNGSRNSFGGLRGFTKTVAFSLESDKQAATQEIAQAVIAAGWRGVPEAMTDADYDAMLAEIAKDVE